MNKYHFLNITFNILHFKSLIYNNLLPQFSLRLRLNIENYFDAQL